MMNEACRMWFHDSRAGRREAERLRRPAGGGTRIEGISGSALALRAAAAAR